MLDVSLTKKLDRFNLDLSFTANPGITAIFGPSGAGKSVLAKMLAGLEKPDAGHITLKNRELYKKQSGALRTHSVPPQKRQIGFVFQEHRLFPHYSVLGNLKYGMKGRSKTRSAPDIQEVIDVLGIAPLLNRKPNSLSGGESQRIAIGRALLSAADMLIMDEPLSSLDGARKGDVLTLIEKLRDQFDQSILYISHSMSEVMRLANEVVLIDKGHLLAQGPTAETLSKHELYPFTGGADAGTVIEAVIQEQDDRFNLCTLTAPIGTITLPKMPRANIGDHIRVHIRARDVALSTLDTNHISILNRFNGIILSIIPTGPGMVDVTLDMGGPLTARITKKSLDQLGLHVGSNVWALVKSVTVNSVEYHHS